MTKNLGIENFKLKCKRGDDQIIQTLCKIGSPQKLDPPLSFVEMWRLWEKYSWIMQNALKSNEWGRICVHKIFKIEIQKGGPNNSDFLQNLVLPKN